MTDLLNEALELAAEGVAVFPLGADKKPKTSHGFHDATTDPETIRKWNWNSGGAIGAAIPDGCFVVDIDPRNGGQVTIDTLVGTGSIFPGTKVHSTKNGGTHRFYKLPESMSGRSLKGTLGPGVDIKVSGRGYVVAPPSPGYEVKFNLPIAEAPEWMLGEIVKPEVDTIKQSASEAKYFPFEHGTPYGLAARDLELDNLANTGEGGRNNALNKAAFALAQLVAGGELSEDATRESLIKVARDIGLEDEEITQTCNSGWEAGLQEPRQAPEKEQEAVNVDPPDESGFWTDYMHAEDVGPPEYYLTPIVPKNAYLLVYGPTEASKSMVFLALAADGSHKGLKTSIYSLENPRHIDVDRVRRWNPNPDNLRISHHLLNLGEPHQVRDLISREKEWGTNWIILDTYSHAFNFRSEDGNAKAIFFAKIIREILHELDCTVILIDHTGYSAHNEPRDASAKRQAVDMSILMEKAADWQPNMPSVFRMTNTKSARFGNPFGVVGRICDKPNSRDLELKWDGRQGDAIYWSL